MRQPGMAANPPKLLVLSSSPPGTRHGGGVIQDQILRRYPRDRYVCFAVHPHEKPNDGEKWPPSLEGVPLQVGALVPRLRLKGERFYQTVLRLLGFQLLAPWRIRQAVAFGRQHQVELVWATLQGEALLLAARVAKGLGVPLVGTIWDDPEGWLADGGYDTLSRRLLLGHFREALRLARRVSTVSEAMQEAYRQEYGLDSQLLRHGHDWEDSAVSPEVNSPRQGVTVGFVGNVYGEDAWLAFLAACARLNAEGGLPPVGVRLLGGKCFPYPHPGVAVDNQGWLPRKEMLRRLAAVDFCYLPYWFTADKRRHAELSFPTKLTTYMAAGRPVLYHGPEYAGVTRIIRAYGLGLCVHSREPEILSLLIKSLITDRELQKALSKASLAAFAGEFNMEVMLKNFASLLGREGLPFHDNNDTPEKS